MRLAVEILTGTLFHVEVDDGAKVSDLKREIAAQAELPYERLILVLDVPGGCECHLLIEDARDGAPLADVGACDGARMYLFFKPLDLVHGRDGRAADDAGCGDSKPSHDSTNSQMLLAAAFSGELGSPPLEWEASPSDTDLDQN